MQRHSTSNVFTSRRLLKWLMVLFASGEAHKITSIYTQYTAASSIKTYIFTIWSRFEWMAFQSYVHSWTYGVNKSPPLYFHCIVEKKEERGRKKNQNHFRICSGKYCPVEVTNSMKILNIPCSDWCWSFANVCVKFIKYDIDISMRIYWISIPVAQSFIWNSFRKQLNVN